ncbi:MAG: CHRD domain-containing protein [Bradymonadaceae bacterium]
MKFLRNLGYLMVASTLLFATGCPEDDDPDPDPDPPDMIFEVELAGDNEIPAVATPATGTMTVNLRGSTISGEGTFEGLTSNLIDIAGSPAHIHIGSSTATGPILFNVDVDADNRSGSFNFEEDLDSDQLLMFEQGTLYLNIHTELYPNGELRGQLIEGTPTFAEIARSFEAILVPDDHVHDVQSQGTGWATAILRQNDTFLVSGAFRDLSSPLVEVEGSSVNIHQAPVAQEGPVFFNLTVDEDTDERGGRFWFDTDLTASQRQILEAEEFYLNIYSQDFEEGELRGQLVTNGEDIDFNNDVEPPIQ